MRISRDHRKLWTAQRWGDCHCDHSLYQLWDSLLHDKSHFWKIPFLGNLNKGGYWRKISSDQSLPQDKRCEQS